jgi:hypothetical protein
MLLETKLGPLPPLVLSSYSLSDGDTVPVGLVNVDRQGIFLIMSGGESHPAAII